MKNHLLALLLLISSFAFCQSFDILRTQSLEIEATPRYSFKTSAVNLGMNFNRIASNNSEMDYFNYILNKYASNSELSISNWGKKTQIFINVGT